MPRELSASGITERSIPTIPTRAGFDEFYGFTSGHWGIYFNPPLDHNGAMVRGNGYLIDDLTDHAIRFMEQNKGPSVLLLRSLQHTPFPHAGARSTSTASSRMSI